MMTRSAILWRLYCTSLLLLPTVFAPAYGASGLKLNPGLDYHSDSNDGPLITGSHMTDGVVNPGQPAHIIFYHHECYNSKRQARTTVELYQKYKEKIKFIIVDLSTEISKEQKDLKTRFYRRYIPHVTIINRSGKVVYDKSGQVGIDTLSKLLDQTLTD